MKKFVCNQCGKSFKREGWLRQHSNLAHPVPDVNGQRVGQRTEISISWLIEERNFLANKVIFIDELLEKFAR